MKDFRKVQVIFFCGNNDITSVGYWNGESITNYDLIYSSVGNLQMKVIKLIGNIMSSC